MTKKIAFIPLLLMTLMLSGCFGEKEEKKVEDVTEKTYETSTFSIKIPKEWEVIEKKDFTSEIPPETEVVFRNNIKHEEFTANVNVTHNLLTQDKSSLDYGKQIIANQKASLLDYKELNRQEIEIQKGDQKEKTVLIFFEGKRLATDKLLRFMQIYGVKGRDAYIATAALRPDEDPGVSKALEKMLRSFSLK